MEPLQYEQRGYLKENFRLFHLADDRGAAMEYHYHNFHKMIMLLSGKASYEIEGERFVLKPGDYILVGRGSIHRPVVESGVFYERMILYISPQFLEELRTEDCDLATCFQRAQKQFRYVYHAGDSEDVIPLFLQLERAGRQGGFGSEVLQKALFLQLMVAVNRAMEQSKPILASRRDDKVIAILHYLNAHLTEEIRIDDLAQRFYISKYHMMRRFKEETGYTIHHYISEKRLLLAQQFLQQGSSLTEVALSVGYQDYSTFSRAFKKQFGYIPSKSR